MASNTQPKRVEFKTVDGTTLRGDLYTVNAPNAPIIIMTQGLTLLKEHYIPTFAIRFQAAGYASLIYDHRGWGSSEKGTIANEVDPLQQAEDYHDAVIFASTLPDIDAKRLCIWGIGHSGAAAMIAAADDPNVKAVVLVMPLLSGRGDAAKFPEGALDRAWEERRKKCLDTTPAAAEYIQPWDNAQTDAEGDRGSTLLHGPVPYKFIAEAKKLSDAVGTPWTNRLNLQSLYYISRVEPKDYLPRISPKPLLHLAAIEDPLSGPPEEHRKVFETAGEPKEFVLLQDHHIANYFEGFEENVRAQVEFLGRWL